MLNKENLENLTNEIWKGAIKLRGKFKAKDYPSVFLPMIMIRRIECVLIQKRMEMAEAIRKQDSTIDETTVQQRVKLQETNLPFYNTTNWTLKGIEKESSTQVEANFRAYLNGFSENIDEIIEKFNYRFWVSGMVKAKRLTAVIQFASDEDFSPARLSNIEMGPVS